MGTLLIYQGEKTRKVPFSGTPLVRDVLIEAGIVHDHPCAGRGVCGKCAAKIIGDLSAASEAEKRFAKDTAIRLTCQCRLLGDAVIWLAQETNAIETGSETIAAAAPMGQKFGCAVDIGTTTLVLNLCDLQSGRILSQQTMMNPQRAVSADVMGRIGAAMDGQLESLQNMIQNALREMLDCGCKDAKIDVQDVEISVITGNTTMLYLLNGRDPKCLCAAPFEADTLFDAFDQKEGMTIYYPPCMNAFVGADITCAVLAGGMPEKNKTAMLCDIGTNGEIALLKEGKLYVTSTAAGPAFEGAGISCGCGSVTGAIDRVWTEDGQIKIHTIADADPVGICGSGLVDAIAAFLELELIDETGAVDDDLILSDQIELQVQDVRAVQLAKAAIGAGIETLLETAGVELDEVETLYIAGGFGSHLDAGSAAAIGLIPKELKDRVSVLGNAALGGAMMMLFDERQLEAARAFAKDAVRVNLGGNAAFNQHYMEHILFGDDDLFDE